MNKTKQINEDLIAFWSNSLALSEEEKEQAASEEAGDYRELAPAPKFIPAIESLKDCKKVLDYGCGTGWASIIAIRGGCKSVTAVDMSEAIAETASIYAKAYGATEGLTVLPIGQDYLSSLPEASFDGLICSNVLDVIPLETTKEIIKEMACVLEKDGKAIIGLNFYLSPETAKQRGMSLENGNMLFVQGVLRLVSLSDEEWTKLFEPYFVVDKLEYFAWPGEAKETRRLFHLHKKR